MPKIRKVEAHFPEIITKKRVAAYARVSMETDNLLHSLSAQVSYYSDLIQRNPEWEYAGVYVDKGITGTSTDKRDEFNNLIADCDTGKIDIIIVKSISRFARDTVDTLQAVRHLKNIGVEIRFERENVSSISGEGELLLTVLASYAQAESESISENAKWSVRKRFEQGIPTTSMRSFGYDWDAENKTLTINKNEAVWVRYIYTQFLGGASIKGIARDLKERGINALRGDPLSRTTIRRILTARMYTGDLILQQYYTPTVKRPRRNDGDVPQYVVEEDHAPIISHEDFEAVQTLLRERVSDNSGYEKTAFAGVVKCGKCGYACNHVRGWKQPEGAARIECNRHKTGECDCLPIRQAELMEITEAILGKRGKLSRIWLYDDHIDFRLTDGRMKTHMRTFPTWGRYATCFSRRTFCGECGASLVRMNQHKGKCWTCSRKKSDKFACENRLLTESELCEAARWLVGDKENHEMRYYCSVEKAVVYSNRIVFYMRDGGECIWERQ